MHFPNPIIKGEILELNHSLRATQQAILRVFDLGGRVSLSQKIEIDPTRPTIYISTNSMSKGINLVKLILSDGMDYTFKVLVR